MEKERTLYRHLHGTIRGAGQVMFQANTLCGLLFLIGIFWGSWIEQEIEVAWGGLAGLLAATLTGHLFSLNHEEGDTGLWGFNGILVGCATMTFLKSSPLSWCVLILCACASVWLREGMNRAMAQWRINSLTMPFVLLTWMALLAARNLEGLTIEGLSQPTLPHPLSPAVNTGPIHLLIYWLRGISQVFLINNWISGLLFLIGLLFSNGWSAFWAAFASALSLALALLFEASGAAVSTGLYSFSAVLTGIALGSIFYHPNWRSALWCILGIGLTFLMQAALDTLLVPWGIPSLTAPFCLTTWLFLLPLFKLDRPTGSQRSAHTDVDHSDWHTRRKTGLK